MRYLPAAALAALLNLASLAPGHAQPAMPVGSWHSDAGASLYLSAQGFCAYTSAQSSWLGWCSWSPNISGGVLTLNPGDGEAAQFNVRWLDANRFSIFSDEFYRRP
jgi:hypothetical protein